jgi:hypothetical protein
VIERSAAVLVAAVAGRRFVLVVRDALVITVGLGLLVIVAVDAREPALVAGGGVAIRALRGPVRRAGLDGEELPVIGARELAGGAVRVAGEARGRLVLVVRDALVMIVRDSMCV